MRALIQRVLQAEVRLPGGEARRIGPGLLIYLGVGQEDGEDAAKKLADKTVNLRIFSNPQGKFDYSVLDQKGEILLIPQFTLYGNLKGGRRPDFTDAAAPDKARPLFDLFAQFLRQAGLGVKTGEFGVPMAIDSLSDGPVTLWLDTEMLKRKNF
ncbi:MAG: D-tyrosyl-tRNA(Tyr) deacylase [Elusimicrobia bacterium RIFCSPHIGHO2_02_FULL_61_10]|nr:MAG: D-tyrosyl-tRNA(Tyr) deacylase [Elusimicrobia bacterium RIFCSPHIGHO2_02_FULL_61_10]